MGSLGEQVVDDYGSISLSLRSHPLALLRPRFSGRGVAKRNGDSRVVECAGEGREVPCAAA